MKKTILNLIAIISISVLINCTNNNAENKQNTGIPSKIILNNGERWVVNEEMTPHIIAMEKSISSYNGSSVDDFRSLGKSLKRNLDNLISSCTMDGQAHDELHVWLLPYMKTVNNLGDVNDANEGEELLNELKTSLNTYKKNFQ